MDVGVEQALFYSFTTQAPRAQRGAFLKQLESEVCLLRKTISGAELAQRIVRPRRFSFHCFRCSCHRARRRR